MRSSNKSHDQKQKEKIYMDLTSPRSLWSLLLLPRGRQEEGGYCVVTSKLMGKHVLRQAVHLRFFAVCIHNASALHRELHTGSERNDLYFRAISAHGSLVSCLELLLHTLITQKAYSISSNHQVTLGLVL